MTQFDWYTVSGETALIEHSSEDQCTTVYLPIPDYLGSKLHPTDGMYPQEYYWWEYADIGSYRSLKDWVDEEIVPHLEELIVSL